MKKNKKREEIKIKRVPECKVCYLPLQHCVCKNLKGIYKMVKKHCVDCGVLIKNPKLNYMKIGNYCPRCNSRYSIDGVPKKKGVLKKK